MKRYAVFVALVALAASVVGCPPSSGQGAQDAAPASARTDSASSADAGPAADAAPWDEGNVPPMQSEELTSRMRHLVEALAQDNADLAKDVVYPRDAWLQTMDIADPGKSWDSRLFGAFKKSVHRLHKRRRHMDRAKFSHFELGKNVTLASPKRRDLKKSAWRVKRSKIHFKIDDKPLSIEIAEMTAFHGAWYVTRLR